MEYIYGRHILDVIDNCNISIINHIMQQLFFWVEWCISHSGSIGFDSRFFEGKLCTVKHVDVLKKSFVEHMQTMNGVDMPVGFCHGDLTLSNMLFLEDGRIGMVDWHDPFLESPLQDICKLFQEIILKWSTQLIDKHYIKYDIVYNHLQQLYDGWIKNLGIDLRLIKVFNCMVLLRLFPYTKQGTFLWNLIYDKCKEVLEI